MYAGSLTSRTCFDRYKDTLDGKDNCFCLGEMIPEESGQERSVHVRLTSCRKKFRDLPVLRYKIFVFFFH